VYGGAEQGVPVEATSGKDLQEAANGWSHDIQVRGESWSPGVDSAQKIRFPVFVSELIFIQSLQAAPSASAAATGAEIAPTPANSADAAPQVNAFNMRVSP
jgi:hypothetical protein